MIWRKKLRSVSIILIKGLDLSVFRKKVFPSASFSQVWLNLNHADLNQLIFFHDLNHNKNLPNFPHYIVLLFFLIIILFK